MRPRFRPQRQQLHRQNSLALARYRRQRGHVAVAEGPPEQSWSGQCLLQCSDAKFDPKIPNFRSFGSNKTDCSEVPLFSA